MSACANVPYTEDARQFVRVARSWDKSRVLRLVGNVQVTLAQKRCVVLHVLTAERAASRARQPSSRRLKGSSTRNAEKKKIYIYISRDRFILYHEREAAGEVAARDDISGNL